MRHFITLIVIVISTQIFSQSVEVETIFNESNDIIIDSLEGLFFSYEGDYFFFKDIGNKRLFYTNRDTLELEKYKYGTLGMYGKYGEINTLYTTQDSFYYKNTQSTILYSNGFGHIVEHITDFTKDNVALTTEKGDSVYYFLNGKLVSSNHKDSISGFIDIDKWCSFSSNGNLLYYINKNGKYYLYKNNEIIKISDESFMQLEINNNGDCFYGICKKGIEGTKFDYMFFPTVNSQSYDTVRTIWEQYLLDNGGFYCSGANPRYILINGKYYNNLLYYPSFITLVDSINYLFITKCKNGIIENYVLHTNKSDLDIGTFPVIKISMNQYDYSLIQKSLIGYQVSKNGKVIKKLIGKPISIDSEGNTFSYKQKPKKAELFYNDSLIIKKQGILIHYQPIEFFELYLNLYSFKNKPFFGKRFDYFEMGNQGYIVWNGKLSQPIKKVQEKTSGDNSPKIGELLAGHIDENGFYLFQYDGERNTTLILNNKIIELGNQIDNILEDSIYFTENEIVFYAVCKNKVKRFKIKN